MRLIDERCNDLIATHTVPQEKIITRCAESPKGLLLHWPFQLIPRFVSYYLPLSLARRGYIREKCTHCFLNAQHTRFIRGYLYARSERAFLRTSLYDDDNDNAPRWPHTHRRVNFRMRERGVFSETTLKKKRIEEYRLRCTGKIYFFSHAALAEIKFCDTRVIMIIIRMSGFESFCMFN